MIKIVTLEIGTWRGMSIGAVHYYGKLVFYDSDLNIIDVDIHRILDEESAFRLTKQTNRSRNPDHWIDFSAEDSTKCFDSKGEIREIAKKIWRDHCPDGDILIEGMFAVGDPQEVIDGNDKTIVDTINGLWERALEIGGYEGDREEMTRISNEYCGLVD